MKIGDYKGFLNCVGNPGAGRMGFPNSDVDPEYIARDFRNEMAVTLGEFVRLPVSPRMISSMECEITNILSKYASILRSSTPEFTILVYQKDYRNRVTPLYPKWDELSDDAIEWASRTSGMSTKEYRNFIVSSVVYPVVAANIQVIIMKSVPEWDSIIGDGFGVNEA